MELLIIRKNYRTRHGKKTMASMNKEGDVQLSLQCNEAFNLNNRFQYGRIAIDSADKDYKNISTFYLIEETDNETINKDNDIIQVHKGKSGAHRFAMNEIATKFKPRFEKLTNRKSLQFKINNEKINGHNVLTFNLINE